MTINDEDRIHFYACNNILKDARDEGTIGKYDKI